MRFGRTRQRRRALLAAIASAVGLLTFGAAGAAAKSGPIDAVLGRRHSRTGRERHEDRLPERLRTDFNTSANAAACSGTQGTDGKPTAAYNSTSSGIGLESWGVDGKPASFGPTNAFVVTEEPPNPTEKTEIENNESTPGSAPSSVLTIPVLQEAIAVLVHLPANCTATSTTFPERLVIGNETLQKIFLGTIVDWSEIKDGGDVLTGTGCSWLADHARRAP